MSYSSSQDAGASSAPNITTLFSEDFIKLLLTKKITLVELLTLQSYHQLLQQLVAHYLSTLDKQTKQIAPAIEAFTSIKEKYEQHIDSVAMYLKKLQHTIYIDFLTHIIEQLTLLANKPKNEIARHAFLELLVAYFNYQLYQTLPGVEALRFPKAAYLKTLGRKTSSTTIAMMKDCESCFTDFFANFIDTYPSGEKDNILEILFSAYQSLKWSDQEGESINITILEKNKKEPVLEKYFNGENQAMIEQLMRQRYGKLANPTPYVTYSLNLSPILTPKPSISIALIGCHGLDEFSNVISKSSIADKQKRVARLIKETNCDMGIQLGDNVYFNGIGMMQGNFYHVSNALYGTRNNLGKMFWAITAGNHDYGCWGHDTTDIAESIFRNDPNLKKENGLQRALNQVFHTYIDKDCLHMPNRYYVLEYDYIAILVIDSNTIVYDLKQQNWIVSTIERLKTNKKWIGIAAHHPLIYMGKRAEHDCEWNKYFTSSVGAKAPWFPKAEQYKPVLKTPKGPTILDLPTKDGRHKYNNIGKFLLAFIDKNKLPIHVWLCAHEHFLGAMNITLKSGSNITQITSGGGGAKVKPNSIRYIDKNGSYDTKSPYTMSEHIVEAKLTCELALENHGFFSLTVSHESITCNAHIIPNQELDKFSYINPKNITATGISILCATTG